jgi:hypothetical protein
MVEARRTRKNMNNSKRVALVKSNGNSYPKVAFSKVCPILQQRNEREREGDFLHLILRKKTQWKTESKELERE